MDQNLSICVVVAVHNRIERTLKFLENFITNANYSNYQIVIIDDGSTDGTSEKLAEKYPDIVILKGTGNLWWTGATNLGVKYALENNFDYVLTINNDALVEPDHLKNLIADQKKYPNSIMGNTLLLNETYLIWAAGVSINWTSLYLFSRNYEGKNVNDSEINEKVFEVETMPGDGVLIPTEVFRKVGLYNQFCFPHYHADTDFVLRARKAGFKAYVTRNALLHNPAIAGEKLVKTKFDYIFSKKSDSYIWALFWYYIFHAPLIYKPLFWIKIIPEFKETFFLRTLRKLIRKFKSM